MNDTGQSQKVNPHAHYEPRSVEQWVRFLATDTRGGFMTFRDMYRSGAFRELSKHPKYVLVLIEALSQLNMEKKKRGDSRRRQSKYKNGGIIYLTQNRLKAVEIGVATQSAAKQALVELGFLDVAETGALNRATVFRVSERWRKWPKVEPQADGKKIAQRMYAERSLSDPNHPIHTKRREAKQNRIQKMNAATIQKMNSTNLVPIQKVNARATDIQQPPIQEVNAFLNVPVGTTKTVFGREAHQTAELQEYVSPRLIAWGCSSCAHLDETAEYIFCSFGPEPRDLTAHEAYCPKRREREQMPARSAALEGRG